MVRDSVRLLAAVALLTLSVACNRPAENQPEAGSTGTAGQSGASAASTVLTGCLERNLRTGQFELVMTGDDARRAGNPNAGMQAGNDRLLLTKSGEVELTQYVGQRITVEGVLGAGQPVTDAGTRSYGSGEGADPSQTRGRKDDSRRMTISAVTNVEGDCALEKR